MNKYYSTELLAKVSQHLANGGVIAYPTESCYGLGCNPFNRQAIDKIFKLKRRSKKKGLIVIAGNITQLKNLIMPLTIADKQELSKYWPGAFSLILPVTDKVPHNLIGHNYKIAVRVTQHNLVKQLCNSLNLPLVSTSANRSGHKSIRNYRECVRQFGNQVMVLPGLTNFAKKPSTIIDWATRQILR